MPLDFSEDIVLAKAATVRKCISVIQKLWFKNDPDVPNWVRLDVTVLNVQRAVEACLDLANHVIAANSLGLPGSAAESIEILIENQVLQASTAPVYRSMIGFRNIAVHNYAALDPDIVSAIVHNHLGDLEQFVETIFNNTVNK